MRKLKNEELERLSPEEFKTAAKVPIILVLDNVRSLHNVGSVFRTCDAFRLEALYLCGITGKPPDRDCQNSPWGYRNGKVGAFSENA
jgi:23S rRNA (guanosine2251-2'-O)-methyltransferase